MNASTTDTPAALTTHSEQQLQNTPLTFKKEELVTSSFVLQLVIALAVLLIALKLFVRYFLTGANRPKVDDNKNFALMVHSSMKLSVRTRVHHVAIGKSHFLITESTNQTHIHEVKVESEDSVEEVAKLSREGAL